jgi:hypothetical protein
MKLILLIWLVLTLIGPIWLYLSGRVDLDSDYATANRESAHLAPEPQTEPAAVIQVYTARAFSWRGIVASHCWISIKPKNADAYTVYQVVGWRTYRGLPALSVAKDIPDRNWFNAVPRVILDIRGEKAEKLIPQIEEAARDYPYINPYVLWPGPNSNTFPAYIARKIPQLHLALPADAVGKDFLPGGAIFAPAPSGTGYQVSLYGLLGLLMAKDEGFEINILGLTYGVKLSPLKILLPGFGYGVNVAKHT